MMSRNGRGGNSREGEFSWRAFSGRAMDRLAFWD